MLDVEGRFTGKTDVLRAFPVGTRSIWRLPGSVKYTHRDHVHNKDVYR